MKEILFKQCYNILESRIS